MKCEQISQYRVNFLGVQCTLTWGKVFLKFLLQSCFRRIKTGDWQGGEASQRALSTALPCIAFDWNAVQCNTSSLQCAVLCLSALDCHALQCIDPPLISTLHCSAPLDGGSPGGSGGRAPRGRWGGHLWNLFAGPAGHQCQRSEMEKAADAADTSVLFFSAGANF